MEKLREIVQHRCIAGSFHFGLGKSTEKFQPVSSHLKKQIARPTLLAGSPTSPLMPSPTPCGDFDGVQTDGCRLQVHLAHDHKKLASDSTKCGERRAVLLQMDQITFPLARLGSITMAGQRGGILEQLLEHDQASVESGKSLTKYQKSYVAPKMARNSRERCRLASTPHKRRRHITHPALRLIVLPETGLAFTSMGCRQAEEPKLREEAGRLCHFPPRTR